VIRIRVPPDWLFHATTFAASYAHLKQQKSPGNPDKIAGIQRWAETWYLCTQAFVRYYGGDFQKIEQRTLSSGWTPSVVMKAGQHKYHLTTTQLHETWCFGSSTSGAVPAKLFDKSKADIFVMSCLVIPDVDIVGWVRKEELSGALEGYRYFIREPMCHPMATCPGLAKRDKNNWYM
jgi:hypothetical protein